MERRYAHGESSEPTPARAGVATVKLTLKADLTSWAERNGVTLEEADRIFRKRLTEANTRALAALTEGLGDMSDSMATAGISTG
ncbi:hypothetical protein [Micromonospora chersina]|uniref:Uncharacterized protein n=1 Tax=Micromonospora chersina TaxID=47854 RepID=A0A1C6U8W9_9ACTN|nr:hypothetical protein [Micromonospora chersina]SCL50540.1 hypothetical protein GA0070603_1011 [Micromonospora chersina]